MPSTANAGTVGTGCARWAERGGRMGRCGHCAGCRLNKYLEWKRKFLLGLQYPGSFIYVVLEAPDYFAGWSRHVAPPVMGALGENRATYDTLWRVPCSCGHWHVPGSALAGIPYGPGDVAVAADAPVDSRRLTEFDGVAAFNLSSGRLVNAMLSKLRKHFLGAECFYAKNLSGDLSGCLMMLIRNPVAVDCDAVGRLLLNTRLTKHDVGWGRLVGCRRVLNPAGPEGVRLADRMLDVVLHGVGENMTGVDGTAKRNAFARYRAALDAADDSSLYTDIDGDFQWELERIDAGREELRWYRRELIYAVRRSPLRDEVIPVAGCPVHADADPDAEPWTWEPLRRGEGCICPVNPRFIGQSSIACYGLGTHLVGCTRGWATGEER